MNINKNFAIMIVLALGFIIAGCESATVLPTTSTTDTTVITATTTTTTVTGQVAAPVFTLASGSYEADTLIVTIECATPGAEIYYTVYGRAAAAAVRAAGTGRTEIALNTSASISAYAVKSGMMDSDPANAQYDLYGWAEIGGGLDANAYAVRPGSLWIGGDFSAAGGVPVARVARWIGNTWEALGSGCDDLVTELAVDSSGDLYAGGYFLNAGGVPANRVAKWNGTVWTALGSGLTSRCQALGVYNNYVYAGGDFSDAGGVANTTNIARWNANTSAWEAMGSGMTGGYVFGMNIDSSGNVYICGSFNSGSVSGVPGTNNIARWNAAGSAWEALGNGTNGTTYAVAFGAAGDVFVGGLFSQAGGVPASYVARWTGTNWEALGSGLNGRVNTLTVGPSGDLYAGGQFTLAGGVAANGVAKWNGSSWSAVGEGTAGTVSDLCFGADEKLVAVGDFAVMGGRPARNVARWGVRK
ncbi:MAG: chitobiase/beta-hexosaminidase C-terminal domain-containing protein [Candidatus Margulisbacteria bacterium]|nr:chitobiase/beta-hexosaminidase C-terminal domain-containing protein [Candidatus Margulisiibacteriota bacterium]